ncbi:Steroid 5 alpha-reductase 3, variant 2 [Balamuthia mandrillaris]
MEEEPMGGQFLLPLLVPFVRCYWVAACLFYCLKFWSPKVDALTSYGKLAKTAGTAATRSSASARLFALLRAPVVTHKLGWTSFYVFGFLWNLLCHWAFFYRLSWDEPNFRYRWLIGALFGLHLIKRIFECLFVHAFSHRYMTLLNFVAGLSYYFMVPLSFVESYDYHHPESLPSAAFLVAIFLFCFGSVLQLHSHRILASLRHNSTKKMTKNRTTASTTQDANYNIPHGGMFRWVSCPHYLGEIILYAALMCLTLLSAPPINYSFLCVYFLYYQKQRLNQTKPKKTQP